MPIPQLRNNKKRNQKWRSHQKKYYISRNKNVSKINNKKSNSTIFNFKNFKRNFFIFIFILFILGIVSMFSFLFWISKDLPDPNQLINREIAQSTKIYDRTGETILYEIHGDEKRTLVTLDQIPDYLEKATIAIEDKNFYHHKGFSFLAIIRTAITNIIYGRKAGASTLTQQFIKNSILSNEKTYIRKIKELMLAYKLEQKFDKNQILQMYLNEIPYGSTSYGVEAASERYFDKKIQDLNLAESATLAALPQAPSRYSPYGSNIDLLINRQEHILDIMVEQGYITQEESDEAKTYQLNFKKQSTNIKAPHFIMYIKEILSEKFGEKMLEQGGLEIITSLDLYKQTIAENIIKELSEKNKKKYNASNTSLVSIDPKTGEILAMVGSKDYFNNDIDGQVNIALSNRQPGSSLKPLVYASTFIKGYTPNTILYDVVTNFSEDEEKPYEPHNYDNEEHGPVSIRKALAGSLNTPAVKAIYLAGVDSVVDLAKDMGYTTLYDKNRFGLSLVLGGAEVKLLEHTNAYSSFARDGKIQSIKPILKIKDSHGNIIEEFKSREKQIMDSNISRMINDILSDNNARAYAFGTQNWLTLGNRPVAAKTGTTNDYRDAWTVGYTPSIVTGVWVGNNDNSAMKRGAAGGTVAAPIWHNYMKEILGNTPIEEFKKPKIKKTSIGVLDGETGLETKIKIDKISGLLASKNTPPEYIEEVSFLEPHSILHYINKNDPINKDAPSSTDDVQYLPWEEAIQKWLTAQDFATSTPPTETDNIHTTENQPILRVISPISNQVITNPLLTSRIETTSKRNISRVEYYINNNLLSTNRFYPYNLEKRIQFLNNGFHNLKIKVCDDVENCTSKEIEFNLILSDNPVNSSTSISISEPSNGLAVSNIDFPLIITSTINNPDAVAKINYYYITDSSPVLINTIQPVNSKQITTTWTNTPPTNTYKIQSEAILWSGKKIKSDDIIIIINNIKN